MIGSMNTKVNINLRKLTIRLLAGSSAAVLFSAVVLSESKAVTHKLVAVPAVEHLHHASAEHVAVVDAVPELFAAESTVGAVHHADDLNVSHVVEVDGLQAVHLKRAESTQHLAHTSVAEHSFGDRDSAFNAKGAGRVFNHAALGVMSDPDVTLSAPRAMDVGYVRRATGIDLFGAPKDWHALAARHGYYVSDKPVPGGVVCFEGGAYGASEAYGFVAVIVYYQDRGEYWEIVARYAYPMEGRGYGNPYVKEQSLRVAKNDPRVHYIYRGGAGTRPGGYYMRPEYVGHNIVGADYVFKGEAKDVVAVGPENGHAQAYVEPGQVVRVLAKAELGETLWVFVETPYRAGVVYAVTNYGGTHLVPYDAASPDASRMYYAKDYGDTVLDLGYADYSRIAGDSGEVTITIKKGNNPARLLPLQTVRLQLGRK